MAEYVAAEVLSYLYVAGVEWGTAVIASYVAEAAIYAAAIGYSQNQASIARRRSREAFNSSQVDRLVNANSTESPRELVMGRVRKGGQIFFRGSTGANNTKFVVCIALAGHEIDAVESFYLNDVPVTVDAFGSVIEAPYRHIENETREVYFSTGATVVTLPELPVAGTVVAMRIYPPFEGGFETYETIAGISVSGSTVTFPYAIPDTNYVVYQSQVVSSAVKLRYFSHSWATTRRCVSPRLTVADAVAHRAVRDQNRSASRCQK